MDHANPFGPILVIGSGLGRSRPWKKSQASFLCTVPNIALTLILLCEGVAVRANQFFCEGFKTVSEILFIDPGDQRPTLNLKQWKVTISPTKLLHWFHSVEQFCRGNSEFSLNPGNFHWFRFRVRLLHWQCRVAVISAKNHKRQRRKRQSVTAKREKSQTPKVLTAILTLPNLT